MKLYENYFDLNMAQYKKKRQYLTNYNEYHMGITPLPKPVKPMTKNQIYREAFFNLITPDVLIPSIGGFSLIIFCWAIKTYGTLAFTGLAGMLVGFGILISKLALGWDAIIQSAVKKIKQQAQQQQEDYFRSLAVKLNYTRSTDDDACLSNLHILYRNFLREVENNKKITQELIEQFNAIHVECLHSLEQSYDLWVYAEKLHEKSRGPFLEQRDSLLKEVQQSVVFLNNLYSDIHAGGVNTQTSKLSNMRKEMELQLEVAKSTRNRMTALEGNQDFSEYLKD